MHTVELTIALTTPFTKHEIERALMQAITDATYWARALNEPNSYAHSDSYATCADTLRVLLHALQQEED